MRLGALIAVAALPLACVLTACDSAPGFPKNEVPARPDQITDFHSLYATNCQACHGANGQNGPAVDLANPEYQALVDDATLRNVIAKGMPGTEMPAFARSAGGMLTDQQVDALVAGMRKEWAKPNAFGGATPPPYAQLNNGDAAHGQQMYKDRCSFCHQQAGQQVNSQVYLSLVSDQALRTIIIAGRPDIHQPDWRNDMEPRPTNGNGIKYGGLAPLPLSSQDVTDIVTYLHSLRNPGAVSAAPNSPRR
jgi:cytochrome c oxidase cbb3-type subunit 3